MNSTDPLQHVAAYRPTPADIDRQWPTARRTAVLARSMSANAASDQASISPVGDVTASGRSGGPIGHSATRQRGFRRALIPASLVAAAVAALLLGQFLIPAGNPGGPSNAAALYQLAATAAAGHPLQPGQFRHEIVHSTQNGVTALQESWTSADGHVWRHDSTGGDSRFYLFPPGDDDINNPSPTFLAGLPTDPSELNKYLRAHVHGSSSTDEAMFVAVGAMLLGGFAPPALRAAALKVLKVTPHVTVQTDHDSLGRPVVKVSFIDHAIRPGETQSLLFDPDTATILESQLTAPGLVYGGTITDQGIVGAVPADVLAGIARQEANPPTAPLDYGGESTQAESAPTTATPVLQTALSTPTAG